jgi:hypothetical protein
MTDDELSRTTSSIDTCLNPADLDRQSLGRRHHDSAGNHTFSLCHDDSWSWSMSYRPPAWYR